MQGNVEFKLFCNHFVVTGLGLSEEFTLPAGNPERNDNLMIRVIVSDLFGAAMEPILFEVRVRLVRV